MSDEMIRLLAAKGGVIQINFGAGFVNQTVNQQFSKLRQDVLEYVEANDLKGVIDVADWNDADRLGKGKEMVDRLSNLVAIFENPALDFRGNRAEGDDLLGDAYEYLVGKFADVNRRNKAGEFYTPRSVVRMMIEILDPQPKDMRDIFEKEFKGMIAESIPFEALEATRNELVAILREELAPDERRFIVSMKEGRPRWDMLALEGVENLPAVKWKLLNISRMDSAKHQKAVRKLRDYLGV